MVIFKIYNVSLWGKKDDNENGSGHETFYTTDIQVRSEQNRKR